MLHLQYVSAGYNVVWNDFWYPGSAAYSLKFLQTLKYANSKWTEWFYLGFAVNKGICGPNIIQFLSDRLWERAEQTVRQCNFSCTPLNGGVVLDILDHKDGKLFEPEKDELLDRLSKLYRALYPIIVPTEKPMFLKENEWIAWQRRFEKTHVQFCQILVCFVQLSVRAVSILTTVRACLSLPPGAYATILCVLHSPQKVCYDTDNEGKHPSVQNKNQNLWRYAT